MPCNASPATQTVGRTRVSVRFSKAMRSGPGRMSSVWFCRWSRSMASVRLCRSRVGSPLTWMNWTQCVTGSKMMMNSSGSWREIVPFSPAGSSTKSSAKVSITGWKSSSSGRSTPELQ